jgi:hypothetical protein
MYLGKIISGIAKSRHCWAMKVSDFAKTTIELPRLMSSDANLTVLISNPPRPYEPQTIAVSYLFLFKLYLYRKITNICNKGKNNL